jgi:hypothetical protein
MTLSSLTNKTKLISYYLGVIFDSLLETIEVSLVDLTWEVIVSITRDATSSNYVVGKFVNLLNNVKVGHIVTNTSWTIVTKFTNCAAPFSTSCSAPTLKEHCNIIEDLITWGRSKAWKELKIEENPFAQKEKSEITRKKNKIKRRELEEKNKWGKKQTQERKKQEKEHMRKSKRKANAKELGGGNPPHLIPYEA